MAQKQGTRGIDIYNLGNWTSQDQYVNNLVRIIVLTELGSIPHLLNFGGDVVSYIGSPISDAPALISNIYTTLVEFLPSWLSVVSVYADDTQELVDNKLNINIEVKNIDTNQTQIVGV